MLRNKREALYRRLHMYTTAVLLSSLIFQMKSHFLKLAQNEHLPMVSMSETLSLRVLSLLRLHQERKHFDINAVVLIFAQMKGMNTTGLTWCSSSSTRQPPWPRFRGKASLAFAGLLALGWSFRPSKTHVFRLVCHRLEKNTRF